MKNCSPNSPGFGALDEIAFWNRELTNTEVNAQFDTLNVLYQGPSKVFDLSRWELTLPVDTLNQLDNTHQPRDISTAGLNAGFQYVDPSTCTKNYFYRDGPTMVFEAPWNGADTDTTGNSPRSELRETLADGSEHNWAPNSEGGTHTLQASCKVISGNSKVVIGQIHAKTPDVEPSPTTVNGVPAVILSYDPSTRVPTVTVKHSPTCTSSTCPDTDYAFAALPAGNDTINYTLQMVGGTAVTLNVTVNSVTKPPINMTQSPYDAAPAWANTTLYFKAGCYYPKATSGTAKVTFSTLTVTPKP